MSGSNIGAPDAPVTVSLGALEEGTVTFSALEEAFGADSLGIIVVKDLPARFVELRRRLLSYSSRLANLPADELAELENPRAKWLVGWSRGREMLRDGVYDTRKGSFYVNCAFYKDPAMTGASGDYPDFPEYTAPNIWPDESILPGFRSTFEELCRLIIDTAVLVARACDRYAEHTIQGYRRGCLERIVRESTTTKARLLHYFPSERSDASASGVLADDHDRTRSGHGLRDVSDDDDDGGDAGDWCAPHLDHGCLTGLTSAMYVDELAQAGCIPAPAAVQAPRATTTISPSGATTASSKSLAPLKELDPSALPRSAGYSKAGLYIVSRTNTPVKISIPSDHLAFQTGEALQVITKGRFKAVPHFVRGPWSRRGLKKEGGAGVDRETMSLARNTLAVFTQPNLADLIIDDDDDDDDDEEDKKSEEDEEGKQHQESTSHAHQTPNLNPNPDLDPGEKPDNKNKKTRRRTKDFATFARETIQKYNPVPIRSYPVPALFLPVLSSSRPLVQPSSPPFVQIFWREGGGGHPR